MSKNMNNLWFRCTVSTAFSELLGLGATFGIISLFVVKIKIQSIVGILLTYLASILSRTIEATFVGQ